MLIIKIDLLIKNHKKICNIIIKIYNQKLKSIRSKIRKIKTKL